MTMNDRLKPLETIEVSIRYWWMLVLLMAAGGGAGFLIFTLTPPTYEAQAGFSFIIDYTKTDKLTDIEADQANVTAADVFLSTKVVDAVIKQSEQQGMGITEKEFRRNAFVDRTNSEWTLRYRSKQSQTAADMTNIWSDNSLNALEGGLKHALVSGFYHKQLDSLARCVEQVTSVEPAAPICGYPSMKELQQTVENASALEKGEAGQSLGLLPGLTISLTRRADAPGEMVGEGRGIFILAGTFLGLLSFILFNGVFIKLLNKNRTV